VCRERSDIKKRFSTLKFHLGTLLEGQKKIMKELSLSSRFTKYGVSEIYSAESIWYLALSLPYRLSLNVCSTFFLNYFLEF